MQVLDKNSEFKGRIEYEPIADLEVTGNYEITLMQTRQLIHSKKSGNMGKCETADEIERLSKIIKAYLKFAETKK